jgi:Flp pilus assembly protein TadG
MTLPVRLRRDETGGVTAELVLLTPLLILLLLLVVAFGRLAGARIEVDGAAAQAARAASIARDPRHRDRHGHRDRNRCARI